MVQLDKKNKIILSLFNFCLTLLVIGLVALLTNNGIGYFVLGFIYFTLLKYLNNLLIKGLLKVQLKKNNKALNEIVESVELTEQKDNEKNS